MKREYKDLELEIVRFDAEDVITASGVDCPRDEDIICDCDDVDGCECNRAMCECVRAFG